MLDRILFIEPQSSTGCCESLRNALCAERREGVDVISEGRNLAEELARFSEASAGLVVLIPAWLADPVVVARIARRAAPDAYLLFLADKPLEAVLRRRLGVAPLLGRQWAIVEPKPEIICEAIREVRWRDAKRSRVQTTIKRVGEQLSQTRPRVETRFRRQALSEQFLLGVLAHGFDAVICFGEDTQVLAWNQAAEKIFGIPEHDVVGRTAAELAKNGGLSSLMGMVSEAFRDGVHGQREVCLPGQSEIRIDVEVSVNPVRDAAGTTVGVALIARDITARRRAEEKVREERKWLQTTLASIGDAVIATDAEGRVVFMNGVAELLTGWNQTDAAGLHLQDVFVIVNETTRAPVQNPVEVVLRTGKVVGLANHTVLIARDRREYPIDDSAAPIRGGDGELLGVVLVFRDVAERRAAERAIEAARDEAFEANKAKDRFLAVLSHELRTPLTPAIAILDSLAGRQQLPVDLRSDLQLVRRNILLEARLVDDLLDVTRISKGKLQLHVEPVNIHRTLEYARDICRGEAAKKSVTLIMEFQAVNHYVCGDLARLQQVFWNLMQNAVKFTPEGGSVTARTCNTDDGRIEVAVSDTGVGIAPEILPRIFDPFEQGTTAVTRRFGGLGLGLAICKALVESHGGAIAASSAGRGSGATFTVSLKVASPAECAGVSQSARAIASQERPLRILLVEDHEDTRGTLQRLLVRKGHDVRTADCVQRALEELQTHSFDLLVTDIGLPDGTGLDLMRAVRDIHPQLRGIALSGFGMDEDVAASLAVGFSQHLTKPVNFQKLEEAIYSTELR